MNAALALALVRSAALVTAAKAMHELFTNDEFHMLSPDERTAIFQALHAEIARIAS